MGIFRTVLIFVKSAVGPFRAAVAGTGSMVTSLTAEGLILWAIRSALTVKRTFPIVDTFQRHLTFMGKSPVELNLFAYSRFVFTYGLCNRSFGETINDSGKDNASFF